MAKSEGSVTTGDRRRAPAPAASSRITTPPDPKPRFDPFQFMREVRAETRKVTWTSWKETWITSVMVGIMVLLTAIFFFAVDGLLHAVVSALLKLANAE